MRKTKKNMKFKNKKKNYYKRYSNNRAYINRRLPSLAKAGMIANRSPPTTVPMGKPVGTLSSLLRSSSVPVGTVSYPDIFSEVPVSLYPELPPMTPLRSMSKEDYVDAVDYEFELKKAEIKLEEAQWAAASATAAREDAEAYVITRQRAVYSWRENAKHSLFRSENAQARVKEAKESLENAKQALEAAITIEGAAVAVKAVAEKELQDAIIKADKFKAAPKISLPRRVMSVTRRIARAVRGSRRKK